MENNGNEFVQLIDIMNRLRAECPWDRKQTIHTLRPLTIEELYELADAITEEDWQGICEELGDLLLHIVFYAKIGSEENRFTIQDVIEGICKKLIDRHPHIYGDITVKNEEEVKQNWEKLKLKEGKASVLSGIPQSLPAVVKATRLQEKAGKIGFEWSDITQVWEKVKEETRELQEAVQTEDKEKIEEEFGDLLFSLINYSRFLNVDAENALELTNKKFKRRFQLMEALAKKEGKQFSALNLTEMDALWDKIKRQEHTLK